MSTVERFDAPSAGVSWADSTDLAEWSLIEVRQLTYRQRVGFLLACGFYRECSAGLLVMDGVRSLAISGSVRQTVYNWELGSVNVADTGLALEISLRAMDTRVGSVEVSAQSMQLFLGSTSTSSLAPPDLNDLDDFQDRAPSWGTPFQVRYSDRVASIGNRA